MQDLALKNFKKTLQLNPEQTSVLIGSILGDGTLQIGKEGKNANFKVEQGLMHKEYALWKYKIFQNWVRTPPKISFRYRSDDTRYQKSWWFRTVRHPQLTFFRKLFYPNGEKIVPLNISEYLDALCLAVWIMDDGSLNKRHLDISTYAFRLEGIKALCEALKENFKVKAKYYKDRDKGYRMYFSVRETKKMGEVVGPHIIPSMTYKLLRTP